MYLLTYQSDYLGACHGLDIPFIFDNIDSTPLVGNRLDKYLMVRAMSDAWIAFIRNGNPNHPGIPKWTGYTAKRRTTMLFDVPCRIEIDPYREELDAWKDIELILP